MEWRIPLRGQPVRPFDALRRVLLYPRTKPHLSHVPAAAAAAAAALYPAIGLLYP